MKGKKFLKIIFFMLLFLLVVPVKALSDDSIQYFDDIFTSNELILNTDVEISDDDSLYSTVSYLVSQYSIYQYYDSGNYSNLSLSINSCDYGSMVCSFNLYNNAFENGNYSSDTVKSYDNITINIDNNIVYPFSMLDNNNIVINYDESLFTYEYEKQNYISNYLNSYYVSDGISSTSYFYNDYYNVIARVERVNSRTTSVVLKRVDNVIFDYTEEPFSDEFKKLTNGTLTIKTDSDITTEIVSAYLSNIPNFTIDGTVANNKVFIKMVEYGDTIVEKEKHLITLVKDSDIDVSLFDSVGYGEYANIPTDTPQNVREYIQNYFNMTNYSLYFDDGSSASYDEIFNYNGVSNDFVIIKYTKRNSEGEFVDIQFHKVPIRFSGYNDTYSDNYMRKVGTELVINSDSLSFESINNNIHYDVRALQCNSDFSVCDIAYRDYDNNIVEIHSVNIKLNNEISSEFIDAFGVKSDKTIDIIMNKDVVFAYGRLYYYYYDSNFNSLSYQCDDTKCNLSLSNYGKGKYETHEFKYNKVESAPTDSYLSLVNDSIDIYPGETQNIYNKLSTYGSNSAFSKVKYDSNVKVDYCDSTASKCSVITRNSDKNLEIHYSGVNIKDGRSPEFDALFPGDTIKINSIYKDDPEYILNVSTAYLMSKTKTWSYLKDFSDGKGIITFNDFESHTMNVEFVKGNNKDKKTVDKIINKMGNDTISIELDDLEFVNSFYYNNGENYANNYNSKKLNDTLSKIINNKHITYFFVEQGGMGNQFFNAFGGKVLLFYDGIAYGISNSNIDTTMRKIIYIPDNTEDTPEAYVKAVQDRIDNYLGKNSGVIVSYVEHLDQEMINDILNDKYLDVSNFDGNYYHISYKDKEDDFIIVKDSSKMQSSTFTAVDVNNNVIVSSDNANYPTNTVVASEKIDGSMLKDLLKKLGLKDAEIIDINLYSPTIGDISDFTSVNFDVSVPINLEKFNSKKLYAYYIDDNGKIEEHPITIDDFMANFKTNHFSTYIISEKADADVETVVSGNDDSKIVSSSSNNPKTFDEITLWVVLCGVSIIGLSSISIYNKKKLI